MWIKYNKLVKMNKDLIHRVVTSTAPGTPLPGPTQPWSFNTQLGIYTRESLANTMKKNRRSWYYYEKISHRSKHGEILERGVVNEVYLRTGSWFDNWVEVQVYTYYSPTDDTEIHMFSDNRVWIEWPCGVPIEGKTVVDRQINEVHKRSSPQRVSV